MSEVSQKNPFMSEVSQNYISKINHEPFEYRRNFTIPFKDLNEKYPTHTNEKSY
jgi:hypothetical protein